MNSSNQTNSSNTTSSSNKTLVRRRRTIDVSALIWGLVLAAAAGVGAWLASGRHLSWEVTRVAAPAFLICLGVLGVVLSRRSR